MASITLSGVEVPAVMPTVSEAWIQDGSRSLALCSQWTRDQRARQVSTRRRVLLLWMPPTTSTTSQRPARSSAAV